MDYGLLLKQAEALADEECRAMPLLSNLSALIYGSLPDLNWAGFYLSDGDALLLGPFQGKVACIRIAYGKGVCGTAVKEGRTIVVRDVHEFPGHIACDSASQSEIVVPIRKDGRIIGVLDVDSPVKNRFTEDDAAGLEPVARLIGQKIILT